MATPKKAKTKYEAPKLRSISQNQLFSQSAEQGTNPNDPYYYSPQNYYQQNSPPYNPMSMYYTNADGSRIPIYEITDNGDSYTLKIELPGVPLSEINLDVNPFEVEVSALPSDQNGTPLFKGRLEVAEEVVPDKTEAISKNGILDVTLVKKRSTEVSRIKVKSK